MEEIMPRVIHLSDEVLGRAQMFDSESPVPVQSLFDAIGYLSTWGAASYDKVVIWADGPASMVAHYTSSSHTRTYTIGAIWNADTQRFGFHS